MFFRGQLTVNLYFLNLTSKVMEHKHVPFVGFLLYVFTCCANCKGDNISNSFMKCRVCSVSVQVRLISICHLILSVSHLMVSGDEITLVNSGALLDSEVFGIIEIPCRGMTNQLSTIRGFLNDATIPELLKQNVQTWAL